MKSKIITLATVIIIMTMHGCSSFRSAEQNPQPNILSGQWKMIKWKTLDDLKAAFPTGVPSFLIDAENGTMGGFNGCNQLNGKLNHTPQSASLQVYAISSTRIFCNTVPEMEFTNALTRVNKYRVSNERLILMVNKDVIMEFERIENK